ncbi:hypothetical protein J2W56_006759 [Nocardia kruczakiae]|uniref:Lycopene cyclase domain-containing protein n=1 Tax=Nocardia kruczakiae TaxID=261477 RepID=A0ABU1XR02_9NOCA|nr:hypothetical protein [Nocardia kruczakiae]MDR7172993.1 hypothetical protein [Nocardia kruczakiae]
MRLSFGGRVTGVRMGVSTRGFGVGVGPFSAGSGWGGRRRGRDRRSSSSPAGGCLPVLGMLFLSCLALAAVLWLVEWPYLLGTRLVVQAGARNPSTAGTLMGWTFEVPYLAFFAMMAIGWITDAVKPTRPQHPPAYNE